MFQVIVVDEFDTVSAWGPYETAQQANDAYEDIAKQFDVDSTEDLFKAGWVFHTTSIPT